MKRVSLCYLWAIALMSLSLFLAKGDPATAVLTLVTILLAIEFCKARRG